MLRLFLLAAGKIFGFRPELAELRLGTRSRILS
jgi:hypothetical protein